jgi:hypothetical protein
VDRYGCGRGGVFDDVGCVVGVALLVASYKDVYNPLEFARHVWNDYSARITGTDAVALLLREDHYG